MGRDCQRTLSGVTVFNQARMMMVMMMGRRRGVAVTSLGVSTKLLYVGPG